MKKLVFRIGQSVFTLGCGLVMAIVAIKVSNYEYAPVAGWFCGCMIGALVSGVFDTKERKERTMHKTLSQGYREAA